MGRQAISTKSAALILTQFKLSFSAPERSFFVWYNPKILKPFCIQNSLNTFQFYQTILYTIVICTQKRILNSILIDVSVQKQKDAFFLTKFCDYGHSAPAELSINSTALIRWIWFWEIWNQVCCCAKEINNKKVILFGDNDPINTQLKPVLVQSGP